MRVSVNGVLYDILPTDRKLDTVTPPEVWKEWESVTVPTTRGMFALCYGGGKFVALGYNSTEAVYSEDGVNWQTGTPLPITKYWSYLTYGDGRYVGLAIQTYEGVYSEDGINWIKTTLPASSATYGAWSSIAYGAGHFIAVSSTESKKYACFYRDNTWKELEFPISGRFPVIIYGNGKFVVLASGAKNTLYSEDGFNWSTGSYPLATSHGWTNAVYGNGKFVAIYSDTYGNGGMYSEDGINWHEISFPSSVTKLNRIGYGDGVFVAPIPHSDAIAYSFDAIEWNVAYVLPGYSDYWGVATYGAGRFLVTPYGGTPMLAISPAKKVKSLITE